MIQFLQQYWRLILEGCFALFTLVFFILKKKPTNVIDGVREDIFKWCLAAVSYVESSGVTGADNKLSCAVQYVYKNFMDKYYPNAENDPSFFGQYSAMAIRYIEAILSTPQKKSK